MIGVNCDFFPRFALLLCKILPNMMLAFFFPHRFFHKYGILKNKEKPEYVNYIDVWSKVQIQKIKSSECK